MWHTEQSPDPKPHTSGNIGDNCNDGDISPWRRWRGHTFEQETTVQRERSSSLPAGKRHRTPLPPVPLTPLANIQVPRAPDSLRSLCSMSTRSVNRSKSATGLGTGRKSRKSVRWGADVQYHHFPTDVDQDSASGSEVLEWELPQQGTKRWADVGVDSVSFSFPERSYSFTTTTHNTARRSHGSDALARSLRFFADGLSDF